MSPTVPPISQSMKVDFVFADGEEIFDLVGDMRDDLDGFAQIIAAAFFFQHGGIDAARRDGIGLARGDAGEAFIVAQIEVGFGAVIGDENFAMLERAHRAGIDVEVGVKLAQADGKAAGLQQCAQVPPRQALCQARTQHRR